MGQGCMLQLTRGAKQCSPIFLSCCLTCSADVAAHQVRVGCYRVSLVVLKATIEEHMKRCRDALGLSLRRKVGCITSCCFTAAMLMTVWDCLPPGVGATT